MFIPSHHVVCYLSFLLHVFPCKNNNISINVPVLARGQVFIFTAVLWQNVVKPMKGQVKKHVTERCRMRHEMAHYSMSRLLVCHYIAMLKSTCSRMRYCSSKKQIISKIIKHAKKNFKQHKSNKNKQNTLAVK